jgi:hypothetical protein
LFEPVNAQLARIAFGSLLRGRFRFSASQVRLLFSIKTKLIRPAMAHGQLTSIQ